ncbi:MAG: hypothetical protein KC731_14010, partial [Myxococcales bacterium]|nr:hypothetical protein [Myxococcales bacterium]
MARSWAQLALVAGLLLGCGDLSDPFARPAATSQASAIPEPELPSARPVGSVAPAEWLAELPDLPPTAQKGERV